MTTFRELISQHGPEDWLYAGLAGALFVPV
jgi:hypothetical protein